MTIVSVVNPIVSVEAQTESIASTTDTIVSTILQPTRFERRQTQSSMKQSLSQLKQTRSSKQLTLFRPKQHRSRARAAPRDREQEFLRSTFATETSTLSLSCIDDLAAAETAAPVISAQYVVPSMVKPLQLHERMTSSARGRRSPTRGAAQGNVSKETGALALQAGCAEWPLPSR
jgi:hypothetical protein